MSHENPVIETIKRRRSIRHFSREPVSEEVINQILESGGWAPSGQNNQPWKFAIIQDKGLKESLAALTHSRAIIQGAPVCIAIFLDHSKSYDRTKDVQAIGASIQNMLLTIHALGLGGVWLGEILKNKDKVGELLETPKELELMAVVAFGHSDRPPERGKRDPIEKKVFLRK
ncbi:MAG: nitroreductase family protein [Syntrophaceae bacterium]|nr:nitroreductase family protein [Syntrophaceae bacterium]